MKDVKLIVTDLDGTLLRNDKTLSPYTLSVIRRCREQGLVFMAATARPPRALEALIPGLSYDGAICHNGAVVVFGGEVLAVQGITPDDTQTILQGILRDHPEARLAAEIDGELYANFDVAIYWPGCPYIPSDFSNLPNKTAEKLMMGISSPDEVDLVNAYLPGELYYVQNCENTLALVMSRRAEKPLGLKLVCEHLCISLSQAVAFGDDYNDISLLQACGTGVAMANAIPAVKAAAACQCASNQEDGVARWLEEQLLSK